jgi:hypothetical protein
MNILLTHLKSRILSAPPLLHYGIQPTVFLLDTTRLRFIPIDNPYLNVNICAVWKKTKESPIVLDFLESIKTVTGTMGADALRNRIANTDKT